MSFTLAINSASPVSMESLKLSLVSVDLANMQTDSASLRWTRRRAADECPLAHNDVVEIFVSGRRIFYGRARLGALTEEGCPIKVLGPWSHLEEHTVTASIHSGSVNSLLGPRVGDTTVATYPPGSIIPTTPSGSYTVPSGPDLVVTWTWGYAYSYIAGANVGTYNVNLSRTGRFWLFRPGGTPGQIYTTLASQYDQLMAHAAHVMSPALWTVGLKQFGGVVAPKARTVADANMADLVRQTLAMKPDAACWWDYSAAGVPVLNARVASLETPVEVIVGARDGQALSGYNLTRLDDLIPDGVIVRWEGDPDSVTGVGIAVFADVFPAATSPTAPRVLVHTVELSTPYVSGLAAEIYASLAVLRAQGQVTIVDRDFALGLRPGMTLRLIGDAQLSSAELWVQSVSWSASDGLARLQIGYPAHLQLRDRLDLRGWLRWTFHGSHYSVVQVIPPP